MPNTQRTNVRKSAGVDARTRRTTTALAYALIQLIQESDGGFKDITVRQILQRAGVGRTTFYSHFRSKEDVLTRRTRVYSASTRRSCSKTPVRSRGCSP